MAQVSFTAKEIEDGSVLRVPVTLDGRPIGDTPVSVEVPVGHHVAAFPDTKTHKSAMPSHEFQVSEGETGAHYEGLYHKIPAAAPPPPHPQHPQPPPHPQPPKPPPAQPQFRCPAGDAVYTTREALRVHIFDMQAKGDRKHVNVRP